MKIRFFKAIAMGDVVDIADAIFNKYAEEVKDPPKVPEEDPRIKEARRLLWEVTNEERKKQKNESNNQYCRCGHTHIDHSKSYDINYTAGMCRNCPCKHFLMP